jgi:hypothetical protein
MQLLNGRLHGWARHHCKYRQCCDTPHTCMRLRACSRWLLLLLPTAAGGSAVLGLSAVFAGAAPAARSAVASVQGWESFKACSNAPSRVASVAVPPVSSQLGTPAPWESQAGRV